LWGGAGGAGPALATFFRPSAVSMLGFFVRVAGRGYARRRRLPLCGITPEYYLADSRTRAAWSSGGIGFWKCRWDCGGAGVTTAWRGRRSGVERKGAAQPLKGRVISQDLGIAKAMPDTTPDCRVTSLPIVSAGQSNSRRWLSHCSVDGLPCVLFDSSWRFVQACR